MTTVTWIVIQSTEVDWAPAMAVGRKFPTREEAAEAVAADPVLTGDDFGNDPGIFLVRLVDDAVPGCTCYGRYICSACVMAQEPLEVERREP